MLYIYFELRTHEIIKQKQETLISSLNLIRQLNEKNAIVTLQTLKSQQLKTVNCLCGSL